MDPKVLNEHEVIETVARSGSDGVDRLLERALDGTFKLTRKAWLVVLHHLHIAGNYDEAPKK